MNCDYYKFIWNENGRNLELILDRKIVGYIYTDIDSNRIAGYYHKDCKYSACIGMHNLDFIKDFIQGIAIADIMEKNYGLTKIDQDKEIWFRSSLSGQWYNEKNAAGNIDAVKVDGKIFMEIPEMADNDNYDHHENTYEDYNNG